MNSIDSVVHSMQGKRARRALDFRFNVGVVSVTNLVFYSLFLPFKRNISIIKVVEKGEFCGNACATFTVNPVLNI